MSTQLKGSVEISPKHGKNWVTFPRFPPSIPNQISNTAALLNQKVNPFHRQRWSSSCGWSWFRCLLIVKIPPGWECSGRSEVGKLGWGKHVHLLQMLPRSAGDECTNHHHHQCSLWSASCLGCTQSPIWPSKLPCKGKTAVPMGENGPRESQVQTQWQSQLSHWLPGCKARGHFSTSLDALRQFLCCPGRATLPGVPFHLLDGARHLHDFRQSALSLELQEASDQSRAFFMSLLDPGAGPARKGCLSKPEHSISLLLMSLQDLLRGLGCNGSRIPWGKCGLREVSRTWPSGPCAVGARVLGGHRCPGVSSPGCQGCS